MDSDFKNCLKLKLNLKMMHLLIKKMLINLAQLFHGFCEHEELPPLDKGAMARLVEYASKLAGVIKKLSTRFDDLIQIVGEAATWAKFQSLK